MPDSRLPKTVRIGGMEKRELRETLRERGVQLNRAAEALFEDDRFTTLAGSEDIEIAALSVADLGLGDGATSSELIARAHASGLVECPLELGPHLRLQFMDQAEGSVGSPATQHRAPPGSLTILSRPLDDRDETPKGFYLRRIEGVPWLRGYWSHADHPWHVDDVVVLARDGRQEPLG